MREQQQSLGVRLDAIGRRLDDTTLAWREAGYPDGKVGEASAFFQHTGSSVNPARQSGPHAHDVIVSPDNRFVLAADELEGPRLIEAHTRLGLGVFSIP